MSACVAEATTALVELVATGVTGQDDAYNLILNALIMTRSQLRELRNVSK